MVGLGTGHHEVAAGGKGGHAVGGTVVDGHHRPCKPPPLAQEVLQKMGVFGALDAVEVAGRNRHGPRPPLAHSHFEGAQVVLAQGALVDHVVTQVGRHPTGHAAQGVAEGAGAHALHAPDPRGGHSAGQQGVFGHRFGRCRTPGAQLGATHHGRVVGARFLAYGAAHRFFQVDVEGAGERGRRRKAGSHGARVDLAVERIEGQAVRAVVEAGGRDPDAVDAGRRVARMSGEQDRLLFNGKLRERCDDILLCLHPADPLGSTARQSPSRPPRTVWFKSHNGTAFGPIGRAGAAGYTSRPPR